tara:strand:+ start:793 stop:1143 length:351 start_codon:yes stop_codon:yes gene_type:complete
MHGPDFSSVDSREKAIAMVDEGTLETLWLMPPEFGGVDDPLNVLYVPRGIAEVKRRTDLNIVAPLMRSGDVQNYTATPEYRGNSLIPMALNISVTDPKEYRTQIVIWGEALDRKSN